MKVHKAIILAGGFGTRLRDVLPDQPKCLAEIRGVPFIFYQLDYLLLNGIDEVIVSVGYRKEQIINKLGDRYKQLNIVYSAEKEPLGTGGAIKLALSQLADEQVFVLNGDTWFPINLADMQHTHLQTGADISMAIKILDDTSRFGRVQIDDSGRVVSFIEKTTVKQKGIINGGIYLFNSCLQQKMPEGKFSIENDFFATECRNLKIQGHISPASFIDIGIPDDLSHAEKELNILNVG